MGTARETPDSSETECARHRRLPSVAGSRVAPGRTETCRGSGFNRRANNLRPEFSRHETTRQSLVVASRGKSRRNGPSFLTPAPAGSSISRTRIQTLRRRPARRRKSRERGVSPQGAVVSDYRSKETAVVRPPLTAIPDTDFSITNAHKETRI